jgi:hypothetical protein
MGTKMLFYSGDQNLYINFVKKKKFISIKQHKNLIVVGAVAPISYAFRNTESNQSIGTFKDSHRLSISYSKPNQVKLHNV